MKREEKLRNSVHDAEIQKKANEKENTVPPAEQHSEVPEEMAITKWEYSLLHKFLKFMSNSNDPAYSRIDMFRFHDVYVSWAKKNHGVDPDAKYKTLSSQEVFWYHIDARIGNVPKNLKIRLATLKARIFINYFGKLVFKNANKLLAEYFRSIKNMDDSPILVVSMKNLRNNFLDWCKYKKGVPRNDAELIMLAALYDEEVFWTVLEYKNMDLPEDDTMDPGYLRIQIGWIFPEDPSITNQE